MAVNLGSTSSKIAYYEDKCCMLKSAVDHTAQELCAYENILDQYEYRKEHIAAFLKENSVDYTVMDAIVSRGGQTHPIPGGAYRINDKMIEEIRSGKFGRHATDIGVILAKAMAEEANAIALVFDPPVTDEFESIARYSGLPELPRASSFHALNQRAVAKKYAGDTGKNYEDLNLIVVHMGGGISVAAHKKGRMVDANNALTGEGPFSTNRAGGLPVGALIDLCFSGKYTREQMMSKINGAGGMMAYLGENDVRIVQGKALAGNTAYKECLDAMLYQTCKEIGCEAAVLHGDVDAVLLTGGIVNSEYVVSYVREMTRYIADIRVYPGEHEMSALALGAYEVLIGKEELKEI
jgi:butyrate kinase